MTSSITLLAWKASPKGTKVGVADVVFPSIGLRMNGLILHRHPESGRHWVQVPSAVVEDRDGRAIIGPDGRPVFKGIASFPDKADGHRLADELMRQVGEG